MTCNVNGCECSKITEDGFCEKHGYYSACDKKYIVKHIQEYLNQIDSTPGKKEKIKLCLNLWFYLSYKKDFMLKIDKKFHATVITKGEQIIKDMGEVKYKNKLKHFENLHSKIKGFC